jgi:pimeloyl-ACP methyl ester carboxylesterase
LLAPDLRGRGASAGLEGPYGLDAHVADIAAVLRRLGAPPVVLIGHSWGAVVALAVAARHPELVRSLLLVDGGLPPAPASGGTATHSNDRVLSRIGATYSSADAYLAPWREHPGFRKHWNSYIERSFAYDLAGEPPELRCTLRPEAFLEDLKTSYFEGDVVERALLGLTRRATLVRAGRNMADEDRPQYAEAAVAPWLGRVPSLRDVLVEGENHYTILHSASGAAAVAAMVREEFACTTS